MIPKKAYVKGNSSEYFLKIVNELYSKVNEPNFVELYSAPFALFCGTTLEYLLNDLLINYSSKYFHEDLQKQYAESLIGLGFNAKLICVLPIITSNKFQINLDSFEYKKLSEVIKKRNQIAHGKDYYNSIEPQDIKEDGSFSISLNGFRQKINFLNVSQTDCKQYKKALDSFYKNIFSVYNDATEFKASTFILKMEKEKTNFHILEME